MSANAQPTPLPLTSLADCLRALQTTVSTLQPDSLTSGEQALVHLRKIVFVLAAHFSQCPDAEAQRMASAAWPDEFSLLKMALQTGLSPHEAGMLNEVKNLYKEGPKSPNFARHFILARLLLIPSHVEQPEAWQEIPQDYIENFVAYQLETTPLILLGEGEKACQHQERVLEKLLAFISSPTTALPDRNKAITLYLSNKNTPYYEMADTNLRPIAILANKILRFIAREGLKAKIDHSFPPRIVGEKIHIGIFAKTLLTGVETIAMLCNISKLDRNKYHITLLHANFNNGYYSEISYYRELVKSVDDIIQIDAQSTEQCVNEIRNLNLDILWHQTHVGIGDNGAYAVLFLHKLARIQCAMVAMCGRTTGNPQFQYFINMKPPFLPKTWEGEFTETELNLSSLCIYIPDDWKHKPNRIVTRESLAIPPDAVIYFAGAAAAKLTPECVEIWLDIIRNAPNSYLLLAPFNPGWVPHHKTILAFHVLFQSALNKGEDISNRIRILGHINGEAIALMHKWGDIHLSSFPYGGVTTISDSLRGGLCPVCPVGHYSRNSGDATILEGYDLKDLVVRSPEEYKELAIRLGTDPSFRASTKLRVKEAYAKRHPLIKEEIATAYANLIEQIVEREFPHPLQQRILKMHFTSTQDEKERFAFKGDTEVFARILEDMNQNAGHLAPIAHWDIGYNRKQNNEALSNEEAYEKNCEKMGSMLDPWIGCRGLLPVDKDEWNKYRAFLEEHDRLALLPQPVDETSLARMGWLNTDLGSVMDVNFIHSFSEPLCTTQNRLYALEVGGGYGRLAETFLTLYEGRVKYVMLDAVPATLMYAYMYLSRQCKDRRIGFYYNDDPFDMEQFDCYIMPSWHFERLNNLKYDIAINVESFQEMGQNHVNYYLDLFNKTTCNNSTIYISNAHDYVFKGIWNYPPNWKRLYINNTPRSWTVDHPTEIFQKTTEAESSLREKNLAMEEAYLRSVGKAAGTKRYGDNSL